MSQTNLFAPKPAPELMDPETRYLYEERWRIIFFRWRVARGRSKAAGTRGDMEKMKTRCRHERNSWLIAGGHVEWCFVCGAWRYMKKVGPNAVTRADPPHDKWNKPSGDPKINPA